MTQAHDKGQAARYVPPEIKEIRGPSHITGAGQDDIRHIVTRAGYYETPPEPAAAPPVDEAARRAAIRRKVSRLIDVGVFRADPYQYARPHPLAVERSPEAWRAIRAWRPAAENIYIHGRTGCGKTAAARWLLLAALHSKRRIYTVGEISGTQFVNRLCRFEHETELSRAETADVLLLDDIDKTPWTARSMACFLEFLDIRADNRRRVIVTANTSPDGLLELLRGVPGANPSTPIAILRRLRPYVRARFGDDAPDLRTVET